MKNIALIIAGGVGARMGQDIPKLFLNVYDKPVIVYTMETFQKHPNIDGIEVVCLDGWHEVPECSLHADMDSRLRLLSAHHCEEALWACSKSSFYLKLYRTGPLPEVGYP